MKILHIIPSYKPAYIYGGPIYSVSALCEWQAKAGHQVFVYTTTANGAAELDVKTNEPYNIEGVVVTYFKRYTKDHSHLSPGLLKTFSKTIKHFDAVHLHSWWNLVAIGTLLIGGFKNKKLVFSPRGSLSEYGKSAKSKFIKSIFSFIIGKRLITKTYFHATSMQEAAECNAIKTTWKGFVAPNIINLPEHITAVGLQPDNDCIRFGFLSRIHPKKGLEILFKALAKSRFNFTCLIAGEGDKAYMDELKEMTTMLGIADKIVWKGMLLKEKKIQFLAESDLIILTSYNENFANVIIESLYCETPVLLSTQVGLSDYVNEKKLGWVVEPDENAIAIALEDIYTKRTTLGEIGKRAGEAVRKDFDAQLIAEKYILAYKDLIHE